MTDLRQHIRQALRSLARRPTFVIVVVLTLAIGLITPPYGLCLLIAADLGEISVARAMRSMLPFYTISLIVVALAVLFPDLMLWIPRLAMARLMP